MNQPEWPRWMDTATAAVYTCFAAGTFENWRYSKDRKGPEWVRLPGGDIRYDRLALDAWMESMRVAS